MEEKKQEPCQSDHTTPAGTSAISLDQVKQALELVKPEYVPDQGWFFELRPNSIDCRCWLDGKLVSHITSVKIWMSVEELIPKAILEVVMPAFRIYNPEVVVVDKDKPSK